MNINKQQCCKDIIFLGILICIALFFFFFKLGDYGLLEPDEGRYSEIPREMLETGNFIVPHLNYIKYFEKPPLQYWLTAFSFKLFGFNEFAARFIPAFFALLGVITLYFLGRRMFNQQVAFLAGLMLITSFEYFALTRILVLDMVLNFFISLALTLFYFGYTSQNKSGLYYHLAYISMALGSLVKGPISLIFPLGIIFFFLLLTNHFKDIKNIRLPSGFLLILLVSAPWYIAVCLKDKNFFYFFFINEHILRFFTKVHGREGNIFYFVGVLLLGFFPWIIFFPLSIIRYFKLRRFKENEPRIIFLLVWFFLIFTFFSISRSKLPAYIILVYFPLSLLVASLVNDYLNNRDDRSLEISFRYTAYILLLFILVFPVAVYEALINDPNLSGAHQDSFKLIFYLLASFVLLLIAIIKNKRKFFIVVNFVMISLILGQIIFSLPKVESFRSARPLAQVINKYKGRNDKIIFYHCYLQSIPFYTKQRAIIIGWKGELEFGLAHTPPQGFFFEETDYLFKFLNGKERVFCITSLENVRDIKKVSEKVYKLAEICGFVLFCNQKIK